ncbi:DUF4440 domain-containing protein [Acidobacteria bacterium AH-259-D05]|nr:DUF4440 domain-containing protein [Acidobacteria bacterium AH-259-D05]
MSDERDAIDKLVQEYAETVSSGDLTSWTKVLAEDVVFQPQDLPQVIGKGAVEAWAKESWFDPFDMNLSFQSEEVEVLGSWAFGRGRFTLGLTPTGGGRSTQANGKFLTIFRREPDGSWKYARTSFSFDAPLEVGG